MDNQSESHTPVVGRPDNYDSDYSVFVKAKDRGEKTFTIRAQDVTGDLVVDFWTMVQLRVRVNVRHGMTVPEAIDAVRTTFGIPKYPDAFNDHKLDGAARIAEAMRDHSPRKLAD
jgi:hypothetical protein